MNKIYIGLFIYFIILINRVTCQRHIYVDWKSKCVNGCGDSNQPFSNLQDAFEYLNSGSLGGLTADEVLPDRVIMSPGYYTGNKNSNIVVKSSVEIIAIEEKYLIPAQNIDVDLNQPVIDCALVSQGFIVKDIFKFKLINIGLHRCVGNQGGALQIENSNVEIVNSLFFRNNAINGGAIYAFNSVVTLISCRFIDNVATGMGTVIFGQDSNVNMLGIMEIPCRSDENYGSSLKNTIRVNNCVFNIWSIENWQLDFYCTDATIFVNDQPLLCSFSYETTDCPYLPGETVIYYDYFFSDKQEYSCPGEPNDLLCSQLENCLACAVCSCSFDGWSLEVYQGITTRSYWEWSGNINRYAVTADNMLKGLETFFNTNVGAVLSSYFKVPYDGKYIFKIVGKNLSIYSFNINSVQYLNFPPTPEFEVTKSIAITSAHVNSVTLRFVSYQDASLIDLAIYWKPENSDEDFKLFQPFYSKAICGDGIYDIGSEDYPGDSLYCPADFNGLTPMDSVCGNGICGEYPSDCFADCHMLFTDHCSEQAPTYPLGDIYSKDDFLGSTIDNQYLFSLPGLQLLSHGVDIVTDKFVNAPIFHFGYCDNSSFSTIHDLYRGYVYTVPEGIHAIPVPKCSYETQSDSYRTSSQMASEMSKETGLSVDAELGGSYWGISASASVAFSQEESVKAASELEKQTSGSIVSTKVECQTTKVQLDGSRLPFHKNFLKDLAEADTVERMRLVVKKYGQVYAKSADMGGRLTSVTVVSHESQNSYTTSDTEKHTELEFSIQVSAPILSVSGDVSVGIDNKISEERQQQFSKDSNRSTIITYGGPSGAYGPDIFGSNNFGSWASSVDLLPVPIRKQYDLIVNLIPPQWKVKGTTTDQTIQNLWTRAEYINMYSQLISNAGHDLEDNESIYYLNCPSCISQETLTISGFTRDPFTGVNTAYAKEVTVSESNIVFVAPLMEITGGVFPHDYEIIDLVNARSFIFGAPASQQALNRYVIRLTKPKAIVCRLNNCLSMPNLFFTLRGRLGSLEAMGAPIQTSNDIQFSFIGKYIGDIDSITISMKVQFTDDVSKINEFDFSTISVTQTCPNAAGDYGEGDLSKCQITKNQPLTTFYNVIYSSVNKSPSRLAYNKPITKSLSKKRLTPVPSVL
ncbi:hypothetical protein DLAC_02957 [Tieghemostelium lacteum]|uniref:MACPF domain-containing protein n=1 Tax=Tieghemostelium lacteum TaxID=361077 RepID=A0A152A479_TIELA|nr:hypothetical protein DLAC_02957 [Tieghemostelium lacteum]|eukprot:KYR00895.1 hypothetical protein DLAC_02957 [Tieghemostelium lacteum]